MTERLSPPVSPSRRGSSSRDRRSRLGRPLAVGLCALLLAACARPNGIVRSARNGDERSLSRALTQAQAEGKLSRGLAREVAKDLLEGELERSRDQRGEKFVSALAPCGRELETALVRRSRTRDEVGGRALLLLVESGRRHGEASDHEHDEIVSYRAAFARSLTGAKRAPERIPLYSDPEVLVRRAALDAALGSTSAPEFDALSDAARHDPDPLCRSKALRLLGTIESPSSLAVLLERYASGSEQQKLATLEGLRESATQSVQARDELYHIATTSEGLLRLSAALVLLEAAVPLEPARRDFLENIIEQTARAGAPSERSLAFRHLDPDSQATRALLRESAKSPSETVQLAALPYLLAQSEDRARTESVLLELAKKDTPSGARAKQILASHGSEKVLPLLLDDAKSEDPEARAAAAEGLLALGRWDQAAVLLGDPEPQLRTRLACTMLTHN